MTAVDEMLAVGAPEADDLAVGQITGGKWDRPLAGAGEDEIDRIEAGRTTGAGRGGARRQRRGRSEEDRASEHG